MVLLGEVVVSWAVGRVVLVGYGEVVRAVARVGVVGEPVVDAG